MGLGERSADQAAHSRHPAMWHQGKGHFRARQKITIPKPEPTSCSVFLGTEPKDVSMFWSKFPEPPQETAASPEAPRDWLCSHWLSLGKAP